GAGFDRVRLSGSAQQTLGDNAPLIVILLVVAFVFVLRGRIWLERVGQRIEAEGTGAGLHLSGFLVSLGQVIVPMIGLVALTRALILTGLFEFYGQELVAYIPAFGLSFFIALWLAGRLFPSAEGVMTPLAVPQAKRPGARFVLLAIGITLALFGILQGLSAVGNFNLESLAALSFPFFAIMGYWLYRMGRVLGSHVPKTGPEGEPAPSVSDRVVALLSRFSKIVGVAAPLLAALGYLNAATALLVPALQSLALFAVLGLLIAACRDAYVLLSRGRGADESLIPVIIAIALFLASVPILALIWGATVNDLREILVRVQAGITIGETTISPSSFLVLVLVFAAGYFVTRFVQSALRTSILPKTKLDIGGQTAVTSGLGYLGIFIAALLAISAAGIDLTSLAFIGATLGVGIGFGLQNIVSNFISGIILLVERPISEGDWIEVGGNMGFVRDISVRSTRIETFDRTDVIIPNADLISGTVTNYTRGNTVGRVIVPVGVAYGTDTRRVEKILLEIAQAHPMVSLNPPPTVYFNGFGESSLDFEIRAILRDVIWVIVVHTELNHAIAERFAEEGIEIPFAQRDIWLRNPEALRPKGPKDLSE
ncbi:MAG: mechanosensitive ion channel domain-containing protein, partial [Pseudomonadota bacterium]